MYKVYCNSQSIYTLADESLTMIDPVVTVKANCAGAFTFTLTPAHPYYEKIKKLTDIITVKRDDEEIFCGRVTDEDTDFFKQKKFTCEGELAYLNDSVQRPAQYSLVSPESFLSSLISNHNSQVDDYKKFTMGTVTVKDGDVSNTSNEISRYTNYETTAECINKKLLEPLGGVLRIRKENGIRYLDYLEDYPEVSTQEITFGSNLLDFSKTISAADISTCCIPLGATKETSEIQSLDERITCADANNGSDYVYIQDAVDLYGKITKTVTWENVTEPKNLVTKAKEWLTDAQYENLVIQAKIIDLHMTDKEISTIRLLQKVRVFSKPHDLNKYFPVTELELHLNDPGNDTITLGSSEKAGTLTASTVQSGETITQMIERLPSKSSLLERAKENASNLIETATSGYIMLKPDAKGNPEELLIMDTNDPATATKVWRWNINGLGYSKSGYNGKYDTAMTMDGSIVADFITAGTMTADRIRAGKLQSTDGLMWMDLDKSELKFKEGTVAGFGGELTINNNLLSYSNLNVGEMKKTEIQFAHNMIEMMIQHINENNAGFFAVESQNTSTGNITYPFTVNAYTVEIGSGCNIVNIFCNLNMNNRSILNTSDMRMKKNIKKSRVKALDAIKKIEFKEFDYKESEVHMNIGEIAQQIMEFMPDAVVKNKDGYYSTNQTVLLQYALKAIKELSDEIEKMNGGK